MELVLNEDQELIAKTALDFTREYSPVSRFRALRDSGDPLGYSRTLFSEMAKLGWTGIPFDETLGGAGMGLAEMVLVFEALGRNLVPEPFLGNVVLAGSALALGGESALRDAWLPGLIEGSKIVAFAHQEAGSRYEPCVMEARAEKSVDGFRLTGEKIQVLDAVGADAVIVPARVSGKTDDRDGITLFLVPTGATGVTVVPQTRLDHRNAALVRLENVSVAMDSIVGPPESGAALLDEVVDRGIVALCAEMLGGMSQAFDLTLEYL